MSEPVRVGDLLAETLADLRKRADGYTGNGAARETLGAQVKTAPESPDVPLRQQRVETEGLARRYEGAPN